MASAVPIVRWNIDPAHSSAEFKVRHMMISNVIGAFCGLRGTFIENVGNPLLSVVKATVDVNTLNTGEDQRDVHLKGAEFFDSENYPKMTFRSTQVERWGNATYKVTGDLTIHGITKAVTFDVEGPNGPAQDPYGQTKVGISAAAKISRYDFGLTWNSVLEKGGVLIGADVQIALEVQFVRS